MRKPTGGGGGIRPRPLFTFLVPYPVGDSSRFPFSLLSYIFSWQLIWLGLLESYTFPSTLNQRWYNTRFFFSQMFPKLTFAKAVKFSFYSESSYKLFYSLCRFFYCSNILNYLVNTFFNDLLCFFLLFYCSYIPLLSLLLVICDNRISYCHY